MMRIINIALLLLAVASATWTYTIKHAAEQRLADIGALERRIALEKQTLELLRTDWEHLSHPRRLQALVERYGDDLGLQTPSSDRFVTAQDLPGPPQFDPGDAIGQIIAAHPDQTLTTGSIDTEGQ